jgi:hypothetical protein
MRLRPTRSVLLIVLVLVTCVVCVLSLRWQETDTQKRFAKIGVGMTRTEVEGILGPSPYIGSEYALSWREGGKVFQVQFGLDWKVVTKQSFDSPDSDWYYRIKSLLGW